MNDLFTEGLSLTVGLRLDYEKLWLDYDSRCDMGFDFGVSAPFLPQPISARWRIGALRRQRAHRLPATPPQVHLQYAWNPENNVYATVSRGYRSGGYNIQMFSDLIQADLRTAMIDAVKQDEVVRQLRRNDSRLPSSDVDVTDATLYKPEYAWNYEAGAHLTAAGGKLQTDLAFFYMDTRDQQISRFAETGLGRITVNAGKAEASERKHRCVPA